MGEVVELPAGRKRNRQVQKIRTVATKDRAANGKQPSFLARAASGAKRFAIDALRITTGNYSASQASCFGLCAVPSA
jgi:hypothetical protein